MAITSHPIALMAFAIAVLKRSRRPRTVSFGPSAGINMPSLIRRQFLIVSDESTIGE
jgi:hypothetical protein